jgi:hypothetical protein
MTGTATEATRTRLRRLLAQIDLGEQLRRRGVQQAIGDALAETWRWRAIEFEWARPRPDDFTGLATPEQLAAADERCRLTALACRRKAAMIDFEAGLPLADPAEVDNLATEETGR